MQTHARTPIRTYEAVRFHGPEGVAARLVFRFPDIAAGRSNYVLELYEQGGDRPHSTARGNRAAMLTACAAFGIPRGVVDPYCGEPGIEDPHFEHDFRVLAERYGRMTDSYSPDLGFWISPAGLRRLEELRTNARLRRPTSTATSSAGSSSTAD